MTQIDYYNEDFKVKGEFFKFEKVGDSVAGTLVEKQQKPSNLNPDQLQWIYTIKRDDGSIALVGGKAYIDNQMKFIKLGQKIALRFAGEKPSKKKGLNPTKIINLYTPKNTDGTPMFDDEFIADNDGSFQGGAEENGIASGSIHETEEDDGEIKVDEPPFDDVPKTETDPNLQKLEEINKLAKEKLGVATDAEVAMAVMNNTGLAFIVQNYDKILEVLRK